MKRTSVLTLVASFACASIAGAQPPAQAPQPGPELRKLEYFIGTWRAEGEMTASMFGLAGKFTNTNRAEWTFDNFYYINQHEEQNPTGKHASLSVTGYDARRKVYIRYNFSRGGQVDHSEGTLRTDSGGVHSMGPDVGTFAGDTWTWTTDYMVGGAVIKTRGIDKPTSPTSYDFTWEIAPHGNDWAIIQRGRATKTP